MKYRVSRQGGSQPPKPLIVVGPRDQLEIQTAQGNFNVYEVDGFLRIEAAESGTGLSMSPVNEAGKVGVVLSTPHFWAGK